METLYDLPILNPTEARSQGYKSLTTLITPGEGDILASIGDAMQGVNAVWITYRGGYELARKSSEVLTD